MEGRRLGKCERAEKKTAKENIKKEEKLNNKPRVKALVKSAF